MSIDVAKIATMNGELLKDMSLEEVLQIHPLIDPADLNFRKAEKVRPIKVKPLSTILADPTVAEHVVLATLEGQEALAANAYVCWGVDNDVWQQTEQKLHDKYDLGHLDPDGWVHCEPKPENETNACQVLEAEHQLGPYAGFSLICPWGDERVMDGKKVNLQYGIANDYVMQVPTDPTDVYRITLKMFRNTYEFV